MRYTKDEFERDMRALQWLRRRAIEKGLSGEIDAFELKRILDYLEFDAPKRLRKLQREINGAFFRRRRAKLDPIKGDSWRVVTAEQAQQAQAEHRVVRRGWDGRNNTYEVKE